MSCAYCLETQTFRDEQVLVRGDHVYLCAPRGQLVEGYLAIAPYRCVGSLSQLPVTHLAEIVRLSAAVSEFYARAYHTAGATFYEQGRGGGGGSIDPLSGFPLHAHLCSLPLPVELHPLLARRFAATKVSGVDKLPVVTAHQPYLYVDTCGERIVYTGDSPADRAELEHSRLKPMIAALLGMPERGNWRTWPGDRELEHLVEEWRTACQI